MVCCIALNLVQLWQYHNGFLHAESMDREKYSYSFLRFDEAHRDRLGGNYQEAPYNPNGMDVVLTESCDLDSPCLFWNSERAARTGRRLFRTEGLCLCPGHRIRHYVLRHYGHLTDRTCAVLGSGPATHGCVSGKRPRVRFRCYRGAARRWHSNTLRTVPIEPVARDTGVWQQLEFRIPVPPLEVGDALTFYLWNKDGRSSFLIDDVFMRISAVRPY